MGGEAEVEGGREVGVGAGVGGFGGAGCSDSTSFWMRVASSRWTDAEFLRRTFETIVTM